MKLLKLLVVLILSAIAINPLCAKSQKFDSLIENKIQACGVLTFTQKELSKSLLVELIDREKSFTLTHLGNRDRVVELLEKILGDKKQSYRIKKEVEGISEKVGISDFFFGGGMIGVVSGVAETTKAYLKDLISSDTKWLVVKSLDSRILDVFFIRDLEKSSKEK